MSEVKSFIERYCPVVEHNIAIQVDYSKSGEKCERCLNEHLCSQKYGPCKNNITLSGRSEN